MKILYNNKMYIKHKRNPHYVWWIENNSGGGIVVDASSHKYDLHYSIIAQAAGIQSPVGLLNKDFE